MDHEASSGTVIDQAAEIGVEAVDVMEQPMELPER